MTEQQEQKIFGAALKLAVDKYRHITGELRATFLRKVQLMQAIKALEELLDIPKRED